MMYLVMAKEVAVTSESGGYISMYSSILGEDTSDLDDGGEHIPMDTGSCGMALCFGRGHYTGSDLSDRGIFLCSRNGEIKLDFNPKSD